MSEAITLASLEGRLPDRKDGRPRRNCNKRPRWMVNRLLEVLDDDGKKIHVYVRKDGTVTREIPENTVVLRGDNWKRRKKNDDDSESDSESEGDIHDILLGMDSDEEPSDDSESDATDDDEETDDDSESDPETEDDSEFEEDPLDDEEEEEEEDGDYLDGDSESELTDSE